MHNPPIRSERSIMSSAYSIMETSSQSESEGSTAITTPPPSRLDIREIESQSPGGKKPGQRQLVPTGSEDEAAAPPSTPTRSRAYQQEMLNRSLRENVIVAALLDGHWERQDSGIIWFLAPTVSLCDQQHKVISCQIRAAKARLLTGSENLDTWRATTWDTVLDGVHIVISTFQVLLDALSHAFVKMERLGLLVFDEAHNCVGKHAGSKIMKDFYHRDKGLGGSVPAILGLTASPSMRSHAKDLETLEATLDARCISPTVHREELIKHVSRPRITHIEYPPRDDDNIAYTRTMRSLQAVYRSLDINNDPYILYLLRNPTEKNKRDAEGAIEKKDTFSQEQLKSLLGRAVEISATLGCWSADRYLWKAITSYLDRISTSHAFFDQWNNEEKRYLSRELQKVTLEKPPNAPQGVSTLSEKLQLLIGELLQVDGDVRGIVFVKERATVTMLQDVLNTRPDVLSKFKIGVKVGESNFVSRKKNMYDLMADMDMEVLQKFRSGAINLLIATSVLEEGIDVPACNLVICFDQPATSKSFIQRRGRARMHDSRLVIFFEKGNNSLKKWLALEEQMKKLYQDEQREAKRLEELEEAEDKGNAFFVVKSTGARLDFDNAKQNLEHFCAILSRGDFVDSRPDYIIQKVGGDPREPFLSATVILPSFLPPEIRRVKSKHTWLSEKNATKDVAFHAYLGLYKAGFVNENLLPLSSGDFRGRRRQEGEIMAEEQLNPWIEVAQMWTNTDTRRVYGVSQHGNDGRKIGDYYILLPTEFALPEPIKLHVDHATTSMLRFKSVKPAELQASDFVDHTSTLLALHYNHRWRVEDRDHVIKIMSARDELARNQIGSRHFDENDEDTRDGKYLIRDHQGRGCTFESMIQSKPPVEDIQSPCWRYEEAPEDARYLSLRKGTRRSDFLHPVFPNSPKETKVTKPYKYVIPITWASVDEIPAAHASFGMLIPPLMHEIGISMVTQKLADTLLKPLQIDNYRLLREAITSRNARGPVNYERLEFLGDSLLKYCTCVHVFAEYTHWHEGYLSFKKDSIVSNERLSRAARESGLSKFIINKSFTGYKWQPFYLEDLLNQVDATPQTSKISTKTLADVVEALIGASFIHGGEKNGMEKAIDCISLFLRPEANWQDIHLRRTALFDAIPADIKLPAVLAPVEQLLQYSFSKKSLLIEAMTHASYVADTAHRSLERLEFLGDAVLDYIIVTKLFHVKPALSNDQMHLLKTAVVNAEFLAFISLEHGVYQQSAVVTTEGHITNESKKLALWQFMRHAASAIGVEQEAITQRYELFRNDICAALERGSHYPWSLLTRLRPRKFYSDMVEALLGAVWIDSGSLQACEGVLHTLGIMKHLERLIRDKVHVRHPKEDMGIWAVAKPVVYDTCAHIGDGEEEGEATYSCKITLGDVVVADVGGCTTKEEAQTMAAEQAVRMLTEESRLRVPGTAVLHHLDALRVQNVGPEVTLHVSALEHESVLEDVVWPHDLVDVAGGVRPEALQRHVPVPRLAAGLHLGVGGAQEQLDVDAGLYRGHGARVEEEAVEDAKTQGGGAEGV
ncbi:Dicer-like protein 2 [Paramyrothecium foliicola]|nr:Dicer-like protein 2 [Paramyrothecium foliicola]